MAPPDQETNQPAGSPVITLDPASPGALETCWKRVGVYGDNSCGELRQFTHCRNCPVFSTAALQLLERPLPAGYRREWTDRLSRPQTDSQAGNVSVVVFRIAEEWMALPTEMLQEVSERRLVHSIPRRRHGVLLGLVNIRGELLPCVSLGQMLGLEKLPPLELQRTQHERLVVTNWHGSRLVFPADEVHGAERFLSSDIKPPPASLSRSTASFTRGLLCWEERTVGLLDPDKVIPALNQTLA